MRKIPILEIQHSKEPIRVLPQLGQDGNKKDSAHKGDEVIMEEQKLAPSNEEELESNIRDRILGTT